MARLPSISTSDSGTPSEAPDLKVVGAAHRADPDLGLAGRDRARIQLDTLRLGDAVVTLEDVDLRLGDGEFVVVFGPSGSGKTTLLNLIGALDTPTSGRITVGSKGISAATRKELLPFGVTPSASSSRASTSSQD